MKVCVCFFMGKHSFGGEKHLSGPPKGSGGKSSSRDHQKGAGGGGVEREGRKHSSRPHLAGGKEERQGSLQNPAALLL